MLFFKRNRLADLIPAAAGVETNEFGVALQNQKIRRAPREGEEDP
jgi:hypothetical protein